MVWEINLTLKAVLKEAIFREQERIRRAEEEIFKLELELSELGVELPLEVENDRV